MSGIYGVGISAVGMLAVSGMIVSSDAYGPIVDNARGIAEMAGMSQKVIDTADVLDAAGNTAKAITKGFAISAAALTVLALFAAYAEVVKIRGIELALSLRDPIVVAGVLLGAMTPPLFSALTMLSVTGNAFKMIEEIRRQFDEHPGILAGTERPDYATCVDLAAQGALVSLVLPAFLAVVFPVLVGFILGPEALGGFLGGSIFTGVIFALLMSNAGGLWDNAKKFIEAGEFGGPRSDAHKASVVGDTVGDPFKDTAGPSVRVINNLPGRYPVEDWRAYYWAVTDDGVPCDRYVTIQLPRGYADACPPVAWGEQGCIYQVRRWGLACLPSLLEAIGFDPTPLVDPNAPPSELVRVYLEATHFDLPGGFIIADPDYNERAHRC